MKPSASLAAVAATVLAAAIPAGAQQTVSPDGTNAAGPITIFQNYVIESTPMRVAIDGGEIDHLKTALREDITADVHTGQNTMTIAWRGPIARMHFKIAFAPHRNDFRNVVVVDDDAQKDPALRAAGTRTITFTIPG